MDLLTAVQIVEEDIESTIEDQIEAWQYLLQEGHCWRLQGRYGRDAMNIIEQGVRAMCGENSVS